ncbi:SOUL family heme-binding protein [Alkalibacterium kapii]|uniref:Heme-binding protein n=1 Tax=Alkalibacterium kapii TaxID=426704 RepID=A0A511ASY9_9LACT|nr:heme-binding protein [Alkalibacterium kapii]GEK91216.1 hypothetical protein AKA01nite_08380 [Alkalibacterium kapii]
MSKYETPDYEILEKESDFELRKYRQFYIVAYDNRKDPNVDRGFRTLFKYISSENEANEKIAMTVPVIQEETEENRKMAFVVPKAYWDRVPQPKDPNLKVERFEEGLFTVVRFSGNRSQTKEQSMKKRLDKWVADKGRIKASSFMLASYNGPFTLPPFKRNEIWVRVKEA